MTRRDEMGPALRWVVRVLRRMIQHLRTDRQHVSSAEKVARAAALVPTFGLLLVILRIRSRLGCTMDVVVTASTGDRFRCHPPDFIQMYLWIFGEWEPDLTTYIRDSLRPGDAFIDVGANIGYFTTLAAHRVGQEGRVVAIEASPNVFAALSETVAMNGLGETVRCVNKAAAARAGSLVVYSGPSKNVGLTTTVESRGFAREAVVDSLPLDELVTAQEARVARLVKIDVEGGEPSVLAGMHEFVVSCRADAEILVELSPLWWSDRSMRPIDVLQPLFEAGFRAYEIDNNYWPWRYLWPRCTRRPRRSTSDLTINSVKRIDLVLSRTDANEL